MLDLNPIAELTLDGSHCVLRLAFGFLCEALGDHFGMIGAFSYRDLGFANRLVCGPFTLSTNSPIENLLKVGRTVPTDT